jgi:VanZ family protein
MIKRISLNEIIRVTKKYIKSILITFIIIYLSLTTSSEFDGFKKFNLFNGFDKFIHLLMYMILAFFLLIEYGKLQNMNFFIKSRIYTAFFYPFLLGVIMEFCQGYFCTTRTPELLDVMFNTGGIIFAWLIFFVAVRK